MATNKHGPLFRTMESLGYSEGDIVRVAHALGASYDKITAVADHSGMTELPTPFAASAKSPFHANTVQQVAQMIKHVTRFKYSLPLDKAVDVDALNIELMKAGATVDDRLWIKQGLYEAGLIPA